MDEVLEQVSQAIVTAVSWGTALCLLVAAIRRPEVRRAWLPLAATLYLLTTTGMLPLWSGPIVGSAWFIAFPLLCFTYPDGRFRPRWTIVPLAVSAAGTVAYVATDAGIAESWWWAPAAALQGMLGLGVLVYRYARRLSSDDRMRLRWPLLAIVIEVSLFMIIMIVEGGTVAEHGPASVAAANIAGIWVAPGFAIGLAWPRLLNVDRALRSVLAAALVAIPIGLLCLVIITVANPLGSSTAWITGGAVAVVAIPLFRLAARVADWLVFRGRADPLSSLRELGTRLDGQLDPTAVPTTLVSLIRDALGFESVTLRGPGETDARAGSQGDSPVTEFPVLYRGEQLATLAVTPRPAELSLTPHDAAVVAELVRQSAPALHGVLTFAELVEARERLERLRETERARLRRDLHDDLAPTLVGLELSAAAIVALSSDRPTVVQLATMLRADAATALSQVRDLAHDLRPGVLDHDGLLVTLQRRLLREGAGPEVRVSGPEGELHLDPRVEVAALRITLEAVSNARRHAGAELISVRVGLDETALLLEIRDDGVGLAGDPSSGVGLSSMRERASEIGGLTLITTAIGGGTIVRARLPLAPVDGAEGAGAAATTRAASSAAAGRSLS